MSNLTPTALRLQRILDAHGIEGIAREVARKDARIAELEAASVQPKSESLPRGHVFDDEWLRRLMNSLPPDWHENTKMVQARLQLADIRPALKALHADADRMRKCLFAMQHAEGVGAESLRTAAYDVVMNCVTSEVLNVRFSRFYVQGGVCMDAKDAALRAARDLITNLRKQDFESFTVAGVAETMDADEAGIIAKYDALIAQIDEVLKS
jgi:hypothetical protein